jgi:uncharacterized membrane protein
MTSATNLSEVERWASLLGGALLAAYGLQQRSRAGYLLASSGGALIAIGATGYCPAYASSSRRGDTRAALAGARGVHVDESVTLYRTPEELYRFWRRFENLPQFASHLVSVTQTDAGTSHWIAKGPGGRTVEWNAEVINDIPNELIGWRTLDGADVTSAGSVSFHPTGKGETRVHVKLQYEPPAGRLGALVAWVMSQEPSQTIREDLRRFKALLEAGEVPTTEGQPRGQQSWLNYD